MAFIPRILDNTALYVAETPDVRTVSLLNFSQAVRGKTAFYTELDSGVAVGDWVFIIGGPFDNVSGLQNPSSLTALFTAQKWQGYLVEGVNRQLNEVVLDIPFLAGVQPCVTANMVVEVQLCKSAFFSGSFKAGQWQEGVFGAPCTQEANISSFFGPTGTGSNVVPVWRQGIWRNGVTTKAEFQSRTDSYTPAKQTVKMTVQQNTLLPVSTTSNNDSVGYNKWLNGTWGAGLSAASQATWYNGQFLGGQWNNGTWRAGKMLANDRPVNWSQGRWQGGVASGVAWRDGVWENGVWNGGTVAVNGHLVDGQGNTVLLVDPKYRKFIREGDLFSVSSVSARGASGQFNQQVHKARDFSVAAASTGNLPVDQFGLIILHPGVAVAELDLTGARIGYNRFEAGTWANGQFLNGMFGFSGDTDDYDIDRIDWEATVFRGGLFAGGIWFSGKFYGGTMTANAFGVRSRWINGKFYNGKFDNSDWEGGLWQAGYAGSNSSFTKPRFTTTLWKGGIMDGGRFNAGNPQPDMMWSSVEWYSGAWHQFKRPQGIGPGEAYLLANSNKQVSNIVSYASSGPALTANVQSGVLRLTVFGMKNAAFLPLEVKANDIIEIDIYRDPQGGQLLHQVHHTLTGPDVSAISLSNNFSETTLAYLSILQTGIPEGHMGEVCARATVYRPVQTPPSYVSDLTVEFVLRPQGGPNTFYSASSDRMPAGTYEIYIQATPTNASPTQTTTNLLQALSITYSTYQLRKRAVGEVFPGASSATTPGGSVSNWTPTNSLFVAQGQSIFVPQYGQSSEEFRRTVLTVYIEAGSSATVSGTIRVSPYGTSTLDKPTSSTFYASFISGPGGGETPPISIFYPPETM